MKRIILCADDYGQNSSISQAIIALLQQNRLSATSCLVNNDTWKEWGEKLKIYWNQSDIGLHCNLTEGTPLSTQLETYFPLKELILKSTWRHLDKHAIIAELHSQLDCFIDTIGHPPAFLDGHQHVHQFPIIRDAILTVYEARLRKYRSYIRCTYQTGALWNISNVAYSKQLIIQLCGGLAFKRMLVDHRIPHNSSFAGIYDFAQSVNYAGLFPQFLSNIHENGIIMCHPGTTSTNHSDTIQQARQHEFDYFCSDEFAKVCHTHNLTLAKFFETQ